MSRGQVVGSTRMFSPTRTVGSDGWLGWVARAGGSTRMVGSVVGGWSRQRDGYI